MLSLEKRPKASKLISATLPAFSWRARLKDIDCFEDVDFLYGISQVLDDLGVLFL